MITCITGRGTDVSLAFVPDCGENAGGYYVEVYLDASGDRHDDFCIHPNDSDCDDIDAVEQYARNYMSEITDY